MYLASCCRKTLFDTQTHIDACVSTASSCSRVDTRGLAWSQGFGLTGFTASTYACGPSGVPLMAHSE